MTLDHAISYIQRHPLRVAALGWAIAMYLLGLVVGLMIGGRHA